MQKTDSIVSENRKEISGILYQLEMNLEKFISEVQKSYALYTQIGEKTSLVKGIEKSLKEDPIDSLFNLSTNIDTQILFFVNSLVEKFLKTQTSLIHLAFKLKSDKRLDLYYLLVLKEDTVQNRENFFSFLDEYEVKQIAHKYPVHFKFTDESLLTGFFIERKIEL